MTRYIIMLLPPLCALGWLYIENRIKARRRAAKKDGLCRILRQIDGYDGGKL